MIKLAALSVLAFTTALTAAPAVAAELRISPPSSALIRVSVAGKTRAQIEVEINAAAKAVCAARLRSPRGEANRACVADSIRDARGQLARLAVADPALSLAKPAKMLASREDKSVIRVAVAGKSDAQLAQEIKAAAQTVCRVSTRGMVGVPFRACVDDAVKDANAQLRELASARPQELASR